MQRHRRDRLTALTRGAALVGVGALAAACTKSAPPNVNGPDPNPTYVPPSINATAEPPRADAASTDVPTASDAGTGAGPIDASWIPRHTINAPPHPPGLPPTKP